MMVDDQIFSLHKLQFELSKIKISFDSIFFDMMSMYYTFLK